jgi:uroporphyrinogen-III synthase
MRACLRRRRQGGKDRSRAAPPAGPHTSKLSGRPVTAGAHSLHTHGLLGRQCGAGRRITKRRRGERNAGSPRSGYVARAQKRARWRCMLFCSGMRRVVTHTARRSGARAAACHLSLCSTATGCMRTSCARYADHPLLLRTAHVPCAASCPLTLQARALIVYGCAPLQAVADCAAGRYAAIILTSARAARELAPLLPLAAPAAAEQSGEAPADTRIFCVGARSAEVLASRRVHLLAPPAGNAEQLLPALLQYTAAAEVARGQGRADAGKAASGGPSERRPFLFLGGDKRLDTIPAGLSAAGAPFTELQVYATRPATSGKVTASLAAAAEAIRRGPADRAGAAIGDHQPATVCLVWFSPSGVAVAEEHPCLRTWLLRQGCATVGEAASSAGQLPEPTWRLLNVALGPTTAAALAARSVDVAATAAKPDAAHVAEAVLACGRSRRP